MPIKNMLISALFLALFAVAGTSLVAWTYDATWERIAENERQALLRSIYQLLPPEGHDNDLTSDYILVTDEALLGSTTPQRVYRARIGGAPVAALLTPSARDGYGGAIKLLVAVQFDGTLVGVRVLSHKETPGLGDPIEVERSDWIHSFAGRNLDNPAASGWRVKKDGGQFDQFTGATITPRAIVKAVYHALLYYREHRDTLFAESPITTEEGHHE